MPPVRLVHISGVGNNAHSPLLLAEATQLDFARSSFGDEDWSKETDDVQTGFNDFVAGWLSQMASDKSNVVGVALQTTDPSSGVFFSSYCHHIDTSDMCD